MRVLKKSIMLFILLDNFLSNLNKRILFRPRYQLTGKCRQCGNCCKRILLKATPGQMASRLFRTIAISWIEWIFEFRLIDVDAERGYLAFSCVNQNPDGTCGNYFWRPNVCRNFPLVPYFEEPVFLPGCGFSSKLYDNIFKRLSIRKDH